MKKIAFLVVLALHGCTTNRALNEDSLVSCIRNDLPPGWQCTVITQKGEKGYPHGLQEPGIRMDFASSGQSFQNANGTQSEKLSPLIQLYLYDITDKSIVLEVIEKEGLYSWDIPIYFGETEKYIVVTSPAYVNHGVFTEEARQSIRPMWNVLRKYIENKGDKAVDQLVQPDK